MVNCTSVIMNASKNYDLQNKDGIYPEAIIIINCVANAPLMLVSIIRNSLVLTAILRTSWLCSPSIVFLCSLAVSDLLVRLAVYSRCFIATLFNSGDSLLQSYNMLASSGCGVSLCTMTAISVDRFLALHYHMRYPNLMSSKRALRIAFFIWFIFPLLSCIHFWGRKIFFFVVVVFVVLCILISTVSYIGIYQIVRRHQLQIHAQ